MTKDKFYNTIHQELADKYHTNYHIIKSICSLHSIGKTEKEIIKFIIYSLNRPCKSKQHRIAAKKGTATKTLPPRGKSIKHYTEFLEFLTTLSSKDFNDIIRIGTQKYL